jgi:F0F1-type ATP synthase assembly protein I
VSLRIKGPEDRKSWVQIATVSSLGIAMAISLMVGVLGGYLLDRYLGTKMFFWIGLVIGILAAYRSLWTIYDRYIRDRKPES